MRVGGHPQTRDFGGGAFKAERPSGITPNPLCQRVIHQGDRNKYTLWSYGFRVPSLVGLLGGGKGAENHDG